MNRVYSIGMLLGLALLLGACSRPTEPDLPINLGLILPKEWQPLGDRWQDVNIDADPEQEHILFYHYNASNNGDVSTPGPIGGVIYDPQAPGSAPDATTEGTSPPAPWLKPYPLMPSYWWGAGYGFIAPPPQTEAPEFLPVKRVRQEEVENRYFEALAAQKGVSVDEVRPAQLPETDELIVFGGQSPMGGPTHISIFWWSNAREGYGSTQVSAPGGLTRLEWDGDERRSPIRRMRARYPQNDRSLLCRESTFERFLDPDFTGADAYRPAVYYVEGPQSLRFCYGIPKQPFYPEGVVLAYLLDQTGHRHLVDADAHSRIASLLGEYSRVDSLQYFSTVDVLASSAAARALANPVKTQVWATLLYVSEDPETGARREQSRLYQFTLQHFPATTSERTTDQWLIIDAERQG